MLYKLKLAPYNKETYLFHLYLQQTQENFQLLLEYH